MIKIQALVIEEFRGIRKLELKPNGHNFAICGPNGTGKSGVVDALEFVITGAITRLSGEGTSSITIKDHAPHIDKKSEPELARVKLIASIPWLSKTFTIERNVDMPTSPTVVPADPEILAVVEELQGHPEFALSRREIIKYVLARPGDRSKEIQELLRLDQIEKVRLSVQTILNSIKSDHKRSAQELELAKAHLLRALGITTFAKEPILRAVNQRRELLSLNKLSDINPETSLKVGIDVPPPSSRIAQKISKTQAFRDVSDLKLALLASDDDIKHKRDQLHALVRELLDNPAILFSLKRETFWRTGFDLIEIDACPFCGTAWDTAALRQHVQKRLTEAIEAAAVKSALEKAAEPVIAALQTTESLIAIVVEHARRLPVPPELKAMIGWATELRVQREKILNLEKLDETASDLSHDYRRSPTSVSVLLENILKGVETLPDPSTADDARDYLTVGQERVERYREVKARNELLTLHEKLVTSLLESYNTSATAVLNRIYADVEGDFAKYYRCINREDEGGFSAKLTPTPGKLALDVDFYRRGFFPPGAYHSEGHQDAMGLCLYLALMKHTMGEAFTFVLLDDVLMSVDAGHRRDVCALLRSDFPNTQFIVTTHDPIWLKHMISEGMVASKSCVQFRKWNLDDGPLVWDGADVWREIEDRLAIGEIAESASCLRRYLEYVGVTLCAQLRAAIELREDAQYDLGDLMNAIASTWSDLLRKGKEAATSWNHRDEVAVLVSRQHEFAERLAKSNIERWALNSTIHYNSWATLDKADFVPVVASFKSLLDSLRCDACQRYFYVTPSKGSREAVRCDCGAVSVNLKKRA